MDSRSRLEDRAVHGLPGVPAFRAAAGLQAEEAHPGAGRFMSVYWS